MILITGLDGSGKSTLLTKLEFALRSEDAVLRVPTIDCELFRSNELLYRMSLFINHIGKLADEKQNPQLKIIAMFGAMLVVPALSNELSKTKETVLFLERHPLIDTRVYGAVYYKLMNSELLNRAFFEALENEFAEEFQFLLNLTPIQSSKSPLSPSHDLMDYLRQLFSQRPEKINQDLQLLFAIQKPSHIYFLDADASILLSRLDSRSTKEHHESVELLTKMRPIYNHVFSELEIPFTTVNASSWKDLDAFTDQLIAEYVK